MGYSPSGFFVHGISQARILEWVAISFSMGSSRPRDWTLISCTGRQVDSLSLYQAPGKPLYMCVCIYTHTHSICYIYIFMYSIYYSYSKTKKHIKNSLMFLPPRGNYYWYDTYSYVIHIFQNYTIFIIKIKIITFILKITFSEVEGSNALTEEQVVSLEDATRLHTVC